MAKKSVNKKDKPTSAAQREGRPVGVYAFSPNPGAWINQQLLKDCGMVPYMLHKLFGYDATMVGIRHGEYPYLEYLPELKMDFLPDCADDDALSQQHLAYLRANYKKIDLMVLNGLYLPYLLLVPEYRKLRPDGKIYLGLDANSAWTDRIDWPNTYVSAMMDHCDVIATSCRKMQTHLNKKWPKWTIEYLPNGFFNPTNESIVTSPDLKENIILTVGRIGTAQKANHVLLEAFASVSQKIPDWKIRLVGEVDDAFQPYLTGYFNRHPDLRDRIIFTGLIESKTELFAEYAKAKIFILTSMYEGAPNVASEALYHGCYMITTDIDAASDITAEQNAGRIFPIEDIPALERILVDVCTRGEKGLEAKFYEAQAYARQNFDWELIIRRLNHLLYKV